MSQPVEVVPGVHRLGTDKVNWYVVVTGDGLTAVDAGLSGFAKTLESDLDWIGHRPEDVNAVVLTHSDADHTGLANALRDKGARVLVHAADEKTLANPGPKGGDAKPVNTLPHLWRPTLWGTIVHFGRRGGARPPKVEGAETYGDADVLDVPGRPRVIATHGHTPGHCALLFDEQGALFVGDALCTWNPLTGRRGAQLMPSAFNVSNDQAEQALGALEDVDADVLLPGHGEPWRRSPAAAVAAAREAGRS